MIPIVIYKGNCELIRLSELLIDRFQTSRPQIPSVFLSSPRLCLYLTESKKYQDSVRFRQNLQGKQKKLPVTVVFLEAPSYARATAYSNIRAYPRKIPPWQNFPLVLLLWETGSGDGAARENFGVLNMIFY